MIDLIMIDDLIVRVKSLREGGFTLAGADGVYYGGCAAMRCDDTHKIKFYRLSMSRDWIDDGDKVSRKRYDFETQDAAAEFAASRLRDLISKGVYND